MIMAQNHRRWNEFIGRIEDKLISAGHDMEEPFGEFEGYPEIIESVLSDMGFSEAEIEASAEYANTFTGE